MKEPFIIKDKEYLIIKEWADQFPELVAGFTTKNGGYSQQEYSSLNMGFHVGDVFENVQNNRHLLAGKLHYSVNQWVGCKQTHEVNIAEITEADRGIGSLDYESALDRVDGLITEDKDVLLTLCYADCVPIFFLAPSKRVIGIVHAGWKGSVHHIVGNMVQKFVEKNASLNDIQVVIGPSICSSCYVVDEKVIRYVDEVLKNQESKPYHIITEGQYKLDLKKLNKTLLLEKGIPEENISTSSYCSSCQDTLFYSHRRDQGKTGRMMAFIGWKGE